MSQEALGELAASLLGETVSITGSKLFDHHPQWFDIRMTTTSERLLSFTATEVHEQTFEAFGLHISEGTTATRVQDRPRRAIVHDLHVLRVELFSRAEWAIVESPPPVTIGVYRNTIDTGPLGTHQSDDAIVVLAGIHLSGASRSLLVHLSPMPGDLEVSDDADFIEQFRRGSTVTFAERSI